MKNCWTETIYLNRKRLVPYVYQGRIQPLGQAPARIAPLELSASPMLHHVPSVLMGLTRSKRPHLAQNAKQGNFQVKERAAARYAQAVHIQIRGLHFALGVYLEHLLCSWQQPALNVLVASTHHMRGRAHVCYVVLGLFLWRILRRAFSVHREKFQALGKAHAKCVMQAHSPDTRHRIAANVLLVCTPCRMHHRVWGACPGNMPDTCLLLCAGAVFLALIRHRGLLHHVQCVPLGAIRLAWAPLFVQNARQEHGVTQKTLQCAKCVQ